MSARERILATASELFYREGIRAIGVYTVVERSGVSKTSLYRLFDSKDALIAAFAAEQDRLFWTWWDRIEERHAADPRALLDALLGGIAKRIVRPDYLGCPFLNLATEFPDINHPGRVIGSGGATRSNCGTGSGRSWPKLAPAIPTGPRLKSRTSSTAHT